MTVSEVKARRHRLASVLGLLTGLLLAAPSSADVQNPLTIDDVFAMSRLSEVALSPDGDLVASVVVRPATDGEVYGRTFYEMDPARSDIWLTSRRTGERRNLTQGRADAAGFWCATWSPDGQRLAMLSTRPEKNEPRGGDNVRLYVWERATGSIRRVSDTAISSQTLGGSATYRVDLRGGPIGDATRRCGAMSDAPFTWIDNAHLLAVALPEGATSGLLDAYSRALRRGATTLAQLRDGRETTVTAVGSGAERVAPSDPATSTVTLALFDLAGAPPVMTPGIPSFPFRNALQILIAPDRSKAAILANTDGIQPRAGEKLVYNYDAWATEKRLGIVDLRDGGLRWIDTSNSGLVLDLLAWSPLGKKLAFRARANLSTRNLGLFALTPATSEIRRVSPETLSVGGSAAGSVLASDMPLFWIDEERLLVRAVRAGTDLEPYDWYRASNGSIALPRRDWWVLGGRSVPENLTGALDKGPVQLWRSAGSGQFRGLGAGKLWAVDATQHRVQVIPAEGLPANPSILWPEDGNRPVPSLVMAGKGNDGRQHYTLVDFRGKSPAFQDIPVDGPRSSVAAVDAERKHVLTSDPAMNGWRLTARDMTSGSTSELLSLDEHLERVRWGKTQLIDYMGDDGQPLKAAMVLPPDYVPGRKYPALVWVYAGSVVRNLDDSALDPYMPGFFNLQLYAAKGYVVLIPSMPLQKRGKSDDFIELSKGVMPAVNRAVELGMVDPDRLAVWGHSYGGFSVYSLVTYTNRFKAAIAMAGVTELTSDYGQFDPTARGFPGVEHEKSDNWGLAENGQKGLSTPPYDDLWHYWRNSPLNYVDRVNTPLLMVHGEQDIRGPMSQAEEFFFSLYRQGKDARLLRYWGEDHGLRLSPANARSIYGEMLGWLDKYIGPGGPATPRNDGR